jgi:hypothetical protein
MTQNHLAMHREHVQWQRDLAAWREDVERWVSELNNAQTLAQVGLRKHLGALEQHAGALELSQQKVKAHEQSIASQERSGQPAKTALERPLCEAHERQGDELTGLASDHEELKRQQHTVVAHLVALIRALEIQTG